VTLEETIADLVYRKETAKGAELELINRMLIGLHYSYEDAGGNATWWTR
jgi:hypothetical protein